MPELEAIRKEVHALSNTIAGLSPLVVDTHSQIPRIAEALESLAVVTTKLENNSEEHKRIHFRINDAEKVVTSLALRVDTLRSDFDGLKDEHIVCVTTRQVEGRIVRTSFWAKAKTKAGEKAVELITLAVIGFVAWMIVSHLPQYPQTAPIIQKATGKP